MCRGCPWDYTAAETDYSKVDAIEVQNGAADFGQPPNVIPNPFTATAIAFYQRALATGAHIAAVGSSDAHKTNESGAVIGQATTVVGATDLSRAAIVQGIRDDHTYVKLYGNDGPDITRHRSRSGRHPTGRSATRSRVPRRSSTSRCCTRAPPRRARASTT